MRYINLVQKVLENLHADAWQLLILEREITKLETSTRSAAETKQLRALLNQYRGISVKLFGSTRADRRKRDGAEDTEINAG